MASWIAHLGRNHGCYLVHVTGGSLLASLAENKGERNEQRALQLRKRVNRFPINILYTAVGRTPLQRCDACSVSSVDCQRLPFEEYDLDVISEFLVKANA